MKSLKVFILLLILTSIFTKCPKGFKKVENSKTHSLSIAFKTGNNVFNSFCYQFESSFKNGNFHESAEFRRVKSSQVLIPDRQMLVGVNVYNINQDNEGIVENPGSTWKCETDQGKIRLTFSGINSEYKLMYEGPATEDYKIKCDPKEKRRNRKLK
jgi:hypothetical protein